MTTKIACIGSGNMGFALMKGAKEGVDIFFTDTDSEKAKNTADTIGAKVLNSNTEAANSCDFIFLAVKPQVLSQVLAEIAPVLNKRLGDLSPVIVSMAAGWSINKIQEALGIQAPVVRIMPNTPSLIGKGMIALSASSQVPAQKLEEIKKILSKAGTVDQIEEKFMDAVTGLSGSGPAFTHFFIEALADGGIKAGLSKEKSLQYAAQTVLGAAAMVQETGKHPSELIDMVTSPGGTTIAGLKALQDGAFADTVKNAVTAAWKRAMELS